MVTTAKLLKLIKAGLHDKSVPDVARWLGLGLMVFVN